MLELNTTSVGGVAFVYPHAIIANLFI